ncbi:hypothetical protein Bbelb_275650 [Branchiostoma belcheri]|nr:hypothetical protein Bbelb_275650 [Branchiostoma belcheri]
MGEKLRHVLILLLIILTELNMPGAGRGRGCSTATRENCKIKDSLYRRYYFCCNYNRRTYPSIPQNLPSYPLPVTIGYTTGPIVGIVLFGSIFYIIRWTRKIRNLPSGPSPKAIVTNTNTTAVVASEHDNQYADIDQHDQAGQSQAIANPKENTSSVVVTHHQYEDIDQHNQTGQSTSHTMTEPNTVTAAVVVTCGADNQHDQQIGQGQSQAITESSPRTPVTCDLDLDHQHENFNQHDQSGQGESHPFDVINPTYNIGETIPQRNTQSLYKDEEQSQDMTESCTTLTASVVSGNDQAGQGLYEATTQPLEVRNPTYST